MILKLFFLISVRLSIVPLVHQIKPLAGSQTTSQIVGSVQHSRLSSGHLKVSNGVPQGSVLGPTLFFTIYINNVGQNITDESLHLYADNTVVYCHANTVVQLL